MFLTSLTLHNFRNYENLTLDFGREGALFYGDNGAGKTNVLEAIYFLCTGRSQRGAAKRDMIRKESDQFFLEGTFFNSKDNKEVTLSLGFARNRALAMKRNNNKVAKLSEFFLNNSIISFSPQDTFLIYGDPTERRKYMDMLLSYTEPEYLHHLIAYKTVMTQRNRLLSLNPSDETLGLYEEIMADHGKEISACRTKLFSFITPAFSSYYDRISGEQERSAVAFNPSIEDDEEEWKGRFLAVLAANRDKDNAIGYTTAGCHRDDFKCSIESQRGKSFGSQGQCRSMALSLRLCALDYLKEHKPGNILILVDDAFSELDKGRAENVYALLQDRGQLFMTSLLHHEWTYKNLQRFTVNNNSVRPQ